MLPLVSLLGLFAGCQPKPESGGAGGKSGKSPAKSLEPRIVNVAAVEAVSLEQVVKVIGTLAAWEQTTVRSKLAGRLQAMHVDLGSAVKRGELIAELEPQDAELGVRQAEARVAEARAALGLPLEGGDEVVVAEQTSAVRQAKAVLDEATRARKRVEGLHRQGIVPESELEGAEATYQVAANRHQGAVEDIRQRQAQLRQRWVDLQIARQLLADTKIVAPFDGLVQERRSSVGEYLRLSDPVVTLVHVDSLRLRMEVPERDAVRVRAGHKVRLMVDGDTRVYSGRLARLSPAITERSRMLAVEADVAREGSLRPGVFARVEIVVSENEHAVAVPRDALVTFAGIEKIYLAHEGKAVEREVRTGRSAGELVELLSGARAGEKVVLSPGNLSSGQPLVVAGPERATARTAPPVPKGGASGP